MDQPISAGALERLRPLVGEWILEAKPPDGPSWPGEARATIEWHDSGAHLVQRSTVDMPEAPDSVSIVGCDAAKGTYFQLYSDERGVYRVYEMSIGDGEWKLWREGEPFPQRFTATIGDYQQTAVTRGADDLRLDFTGRTVAPGRGTIFLRQFGGTVCALSFFAVQGGALSYDQTVNALLAALRPAGAIGQTGTPEWMSPIAASHE
jgi:hypothetical protein